ncbi:recombinase [Neobacillus drentensis]
MAKAKGKHLGRPQLNLSKLSKYRRQTLEQNYQKWKSKEMTGVDFMTLLELKKNSFYKIIGEYEKTL